MVFAADNSLWVVAEVKVEHVSDGGRVLFTGLAQVAEPTALAFDHRGRLPE